MCAAREKLNSPLGEVVFVLLASTNSHNDSLPLRVPLALSDCLEHLEPFALRLGIHAPFRFRVVGLFEGLFQWCVGRSKDGSWYEYRPRTALMWKVPVDHEVEAVGVERREYMFEGRRGYVWVS